jgi:hypothetical protein
MSTRSGAGKIINEDVSVLATGSERGIEVADAVAHVMDTWTAPGDELGDRRIRTERLKQLDLGIAKGEMDDSGTVGFFRSANVHAEYVAIERSRSFDVVDGDAEMRDRGFHGRKLAADWRVVDHYMQHHQERKG